MNLPKLWGHVLVARPPVLVAVLAGTWVSAKIAGVDWDDFAVKIAISILALCGASMMINDWSNSEEDSVNKPHRPIPSSLVRRKHALIMSIVVFSAGIGVSFLASWRAGAVAVTIMLASVVYSMGLKRVPFLGNLLVALIAAYPFWCWALLLQKYGPVYLATSFAVVFFNFGVEIIKTGEDLAGDSSVGIETVATLLGAPTAYRLGGGGICIALLLTSVPLFLGRTHPIYVGFLSLALLFGTAMCHRAFSLPRCSTAKENRYFRRAFNTIMLAMIIAFVGLGR